MPFRQSRAFVRFSRSRSHPTGRAEGFDDRVGERTYDAAYVVVEKTAVIDDPRYDFGSGFFRGRKAKAARPRLQRIEDDHGPVDQAAGIARGKE